LLSGANAPLLLAADPFQPALLLTPVPGRMVKALSLTPAEQRTLHWQAGRWLRRFHGGTGELSPQDHADAAAESTAPPRTQTTTWAGSET
jgi:hypothetical protein